MGYLLTIILLYLLYRFVAGFVWPVYKATSQVKKQFDQMRQHMESHENSFSANARSASYSEKPKFDPGGDYIPFEEVKEK